MLILYVYLVTLFIAPQLWVEPFVGLKVDYIIYPVWFLYVALSGRLFRVRWCAADFFFLGFIAWMAVSLVANDTAYQIGPIVGMHYFKWFVLYVLVRATVNSPEQLRSAVAFMVALVYVLVVEGIDHKLSEDGINWAGQPLGWVDPSVIEAGGSGRTRWVGNFDGIGVFAVTYTVALPFVLQYVSAAWPATVRVFNLLVLPFLFVALYFTGSRGAFLATLSLVCLFLAMKYKVSIRTILIASLVVTAALALAPSHLTQTRDTNKSAQNRVDVWAQGLGMISSKPVTGVGRGNFVAHTRTIIAHNSAMEILAETGLPGIFLWVSLITASLRAAYLRWQAASSAPDRSVLTGMMMCVLGYIVSSMFVTLEYETLYLLLALCVGGVTQEQARQVYRLKEFALCLGIITVFVMGIKVLVTLYF